MIESRTRWFEPCWQRVVALMIERKLAWPGLDSGSAHSHFFLASAHRSVNIRRKNAGAALMIESSTRWFEPCWQRVAAGKKTLVSTSQM
jgi:hypothetical protein